MTHGVIVYLLRSRANWMAAATFLAVAAALYIYPPAQHAFYPRCLLYQWTGWLCPGCGSLRALHELAHGNLAEAFLLNSLLVLLLPALAVYIFCKLKGSPHIPLSRWTALAQVAVVVAFWIARNVSSVNGL